MQPFLLFVYRKPFLFPKLFVFQVSDQMCENAPPCQQKITKKKNNDYSTKKHLLFMLLQVSWEEAGPNTTLNCAGHYHTPNRMKSHPTEALRLLLCQFIVQLNLSVLYAWLM